MKTEYVPIFRGTSSTTRIATTWYQLPFCQSFRCAPKRKKRLGRTQSHTRVCLVWSRKRKPVTDNCPINLRRKLLNHFCHWLEFIANYWTAVYLSCWCGEQKQQQKKSGCAMHFLTLKEVSSCFERRLHYQHKQPIKRNGNYKKNYAERKIDYYIATDRWSSNIDGWNN